jgi:hypothetical protein
MCEAGDRGDDTETDDELDRGQRTHYPTFPLPRKYDTSNRNLSLPQLLTASY